MMRFLKGDISLTLVVFTFLVNRLGRRPTDLLLRYSWKGAIGLYKRPLAAFGSSRLGSGHTTSFTPCYKYDHAPMTFDIPAENMLIARGSVILQFWVLSSLGLRQRQYWWEIRACRSINATSHFPNPI